MKLIRLSLLIIPMVFLTGWNHDYTPPPYPSYPQAEDPSGFEQTMKDVDEQLRQYKRQQEEERRHRELLEELRQLRQQNQLSR